MTSVRSWGNAECCVDWSSVLLGNGFSINLWPDFTYGTLRKHSGLPAAIIDLIDVTNPNFEATLRVLEVVADDR